MDRRNFLRSAAFASTAAVLTSESSTAIDDVDPELVDELVEHVHQYDKSDEHQQRAALALVAAKNWGQKVGLNFDWQPSQQFDSQTGEQFYTCYAVLDSTIVGRSDGWWASTYLNPSCEVARIWAECELALSVMHDFSPAVNDYMDVNIHGAPLDTDIES